MSPLLVGLIATGQLTYHFHREMKQTKRTWEALFNLIAMDMGHIGHAKVGVPLLKRYYHDGTVVAMLAAAGKLANAISSRTAH